MRQQIATFVPTAQELQLIGTLNGLGADSWERRPLVSGGRDLTADRDALKKRIRDYLVQQQEQHCAYCTVDLATMGCDIDHVARKAVFERLTWHPENLLGACVTCNRFVKGNRALERNGSGIANNAVTNPRALAYDIVHPGIEDPLIHIDWDQDRLVCHGHHTGTGQFTIELFRLKDPTMTFSRIANYGKRQFGLNAVDEAQVQEIVATLRAPNS